MVSFVPAQKTRLLLGHLNLSGYSRGLNQATQVQMLDRTVFTDTATTYLAGLDTSTASIDMLLDTDATADGQFDALHDYKSATPQPLTIAVEGLTAGNQVMMVDALETNITTGSQVADLVTASAEFQTDGPTDPGVILEDVTAITTDTNGASVDNGASSANGGVAHLHVTAYSGLTSNDITIEHSANDSTWATLVTFTQVSGVTSERVVVPAGTTVNRYLRVVDDVDGTGSCTRAVAFARR